MDAFWEKIKKELVYHCDCTVNCEDNYFEIGQTQIVHSPIGAYREAANVQSSRFGYRFALPEKQVPYLLEVTYPDDKPRFMCIQDGTSYDMSIGLQVAGDGDEPTGTMKTAYTLFWPRWTDQTLVVTSYDIPADFPAALASFSVYRLLELPEAEMPDECRGENKRTVGVQYEDPCNVGTSEGSYDFGTWLERHIKCMKMSGQTVMAYPVNWYHGPLFPVKSQPYHRFNSICCEDRKIYTRSTFDAPDWPEYMLSRFDQEGLELKMTFTLMRLGNLMKAQNTDIESIKSGAPTVNNVLYNGKVQTSTNDWTRPYNSLAFKNWIAGYEDKKEGRPMKFQAAYGETPTTDVRVPIFNPLSQEVQRQVIEYFDEIAEKYAHHPSFKGISVNFWHGTMLWYANLMAGYDDESFAMFEKETGIRSGIDFDDPERFEKRYPWVMENCKEEFISFRCKKIREFILKIRDTVRSRKKDLVLGINIWNETSYLAYTHGKGHMSQHVGPGEKFANRPSNYDLYREGGVDIAMFENDEGIELCVEHNASRDRGNKHVGLDEAYRFSDFIFLDEKVNRSLEKSGKCVGFNFDCWLELWGSHTKFEPPADDKNLEFMKTLPDYTYDYVFRENSSYTDDPDKKFFFDSQLRICSPYPDDFRFTEYLTLDIALRDALSITSGGLYLDKQHLPAKLAVAREFRKLPAVPFTTLVCRGPAVVRYHFDGENTYVYAVNREPYDLPVTVNCKGCKLEAVIAPYMLKVWIEKGKAELIDAVATAPEAKVKEYKERAELLLEKLSRAPKDASWAKGADKISELIKKSIAAENYADLRHLLSCYIAEKAYLIEV